jgi:hypothetical protein
MVPLILLAAAGGHLAGNLVARTPAREVELFSSWDSRAALLLFGLAALAVLVVAGPATLRMLVGRSRLGHLRFCRR